MEKQFERYHPDMDVLHHGFRTQPCFVCRILAGRNERPQYFVYEDQQGAWASWSKGVLKIPQDEMARG